MFGDEPLELGLSRELACFSVETSGSVELVNLRQSYLSFSRVVEHVW